MPPAEDAQNQRVPAQQKGKVVAKDRTETTSSPYSIVDDMKKIKAGLTLFDVM